MDFELFGLFSITDNHGGLQRRGVGIFLSDLFPVQVLHFEDDSVPFLNFEDDSVPFILL